MADGTWSLAEAKAKFSEVVDRALREGPQHITRHGRLAVVVLPEAEWRRASARPRPFSEVLFDPSVRGLLTDEEIGALFARDGGPERTIEF
ncbi:MAG TPA: type II toxin-antitoxin system Phd/YefM family antitoxin [Caulobacteraceae bacterium]